MVVHGQPSRAPANGPQLAQEARLDNATAHGLVVETALARKSTRSPMMRSGCDKWTA